MKASGVEPNPLCSIGGSSDRPALRRNIVRIMRAIDQSQKSERLERGCVALAFCGTGENLGRNFGFHRRRTPRFRKCHGDIVKNRLHQLNQFGLKNRSTHRRILTRYAPAYSMRDSRGASVGYPTRAPCYFIRPRRPPFSLKPFRKVALWNEPDQRRCRNT
jgi:hypothetical protein